jgi:hypothetical protein
MADDIRRSLRIYQGMLRQRLCHALCGGVRLLLAGHQVQRITLRLHAALPVLGLHEPRPCSIKMQVWAAGNSQQVCCLCHSEAMVHTAIRQTTSTSCTSAATSTAATATPATTASVTKTTAAAAVTSSRSAECQHEGLILGKSYMVDALLNSEFMKHL